MSGDEKPPTLRQQIDNLTGAVEALSLNLNAKQEQTAAEPPMTEARALDVCMAALDALTQRDRNRAGSTYNYGYSQSSGNVGRILRHLADRFGVSLVEVREQPCSRQHLDRLTPDALHSAVAAIVGGAS